jgi:hypothetical protein
LPLVPPPPPLASTEPGFVKVCKLRMSTSFSFQWIVPSPFFGSYPPTAAFTIPSLLRPLIVSEAASSSTSDMGLLDKDASHLLIARSTLSLISQTNSSREEHSLLPLDLQTIRAVVEQFIAFSTQSLSQSQSPPPPNPASLLIERSVIDSRLTVSLISPLSCLLSHSTGSSLFISSLELSIVTHTRPMS